MRNQTAVSGIKLASLPLDHKDLCESGNKFSSIFEFKNISVFRSRNMYLNDSTILGNSTQTIQ